jgi:hypothetical protein
MRHFRILVGALFALVLVSAEALAHGGPTVLRLPPISVAGAPRTLVTMAVPIPGELRDAPRVAFMVEMTGPVEVVGRLEGILESVSPNRSARSVMITLRIPADALVGLLDVADVTFTAPDGRTVVVPIILRVPAVRSIRVSGAREIRALRGGDRVELVYQVQNLGNAVEIFDASVASPAGWVLRLPRSMRVTVAPHSETEVAFVVGVPSGVNAGDYIVSTSLSPVGRPDSVVTASAATYLRVLESDAQIPGLMLEPLVAVSSTAETMHIVTGARVAGPIGNEMRLNATVLPRPSQNGLHTVGLSAVGAIGAPFHATLAGRNWNVQAGMVGARLSELTGLNITGTGATGSYRNDRFEAQVVAAGPLSSGNSDGAFIGGTFHTQLAFGRVGASASHLREEFVGGNGRELSALGVDWLSNSVGTMRFGGGVALRQLATGSELGAEGRVIHERDGESARLRISHTPGGTSAFASSTDAIDFEVRKDFNDRWTGDATANRVSDVNTTFTNVKSTSFSVGQRYQATEALSLNLRGSTNAYRVEASSLAGQFGSRDDGLSAGAELAIGHTTATASTRLGMLSRETALLSGGTDRVRAGQLNAQLGLSRPWEGLGVTSANISVSRTGDGVGIPGQFISAQARWAELPLMLGTRVVRLGSDVQYLKATGGSSYVIARATAATALPGNLDLAMSFERNPYFRDEAGNAGWVAAMRVSVRTQMLAANRFSPPGMVYEDRNANGVRDAGERGVAGVVLRQGNVRLVTNREGTYRVPASVRGRLRIDPASIPAGFVAHPRYAVDSLEQRDIPLVPTGSVTVGLTLVADSLGRRPDVDLGLAQLWLRDASGLEWVGVAVGDGSFRFDQIPIGRYTLRSDFRRLSEPVRIDENATVDVVPGAQSVRVIEARGRTIRMTIPAPRSGTGRGGNGRGAGRGTK